MRKGSKHSVKTRLKMSTAIRKSSVRPPCKESTKLKLRTIYLGSTRSNETKQKISASLKERNKNCRKKSEEQFCKNNHDTFTVGRTNLGICKVCNSIYKKEWYLVKSCERIGITVEFYNSLPKVCSFPDCGTTVPGGTGTFHKDHDHTTGKFRGLLCQKHNRQVADLTLSEAHRVVDYLKRFDPLSLKSN